MRHLDPADRISLINEALTYLFEIKDKPLQQMMGTGWVAQSTPTLDKTNKPTTPTIGAYDTSPEAENVRRITTRAQADRQLTTDLTGVESTGNMGLDVANRLLNPMGRFQQTLGDIAAVRGAGAGRSPTVTRRSTNTKRVGNQQSTETSLSKAAETSLSKAASSDFSGMEPLEIKSVMTKNQPKVPEHLKMPGGVGKPTIDASNPFDLDLLKFVRDRVDFIRAGKLEDTNPKAAAHLYNKTKTSGTGVGLQGSRLVIDPLLGADVARLTYPDKSTEELKRAYDRQKQSFDGMGEKAKEFVTTYFSNPNDSQLNMFNPVRLAFDNKYNKEWSRKMNLDVGSWARPETDVRAAYIGRQPGNDEPSIILPANKGSRVTTDYEYEIPTSEYSNIRRSVSKNLNPIQRTINRIANAVRPLSSKNEIADSLSKTGTLDPETVRTLQHEYGHHLAGNSRAIRAEDELDVPYKLKKSEGAAEARANIISSRRTETTPLWDRVISNLTGKPLRHRTSSNLEPIAPDKIENILKNSDFADPTRDLDPETRKQVIDYFGNMVVRKNQNKQPGTETTRMA